MSRVGAAKALGDQHLEVLPEELGARVAEDPLRLRVDQQDPPVVADDDHRVRRSIKQLAVALGRSRGELLERGRVLSMSLLQLHEVGHVLDAMDDERDTAVIIEDGRIDGAPVPLLEASPLGGGARNIVLLNRDRVGLTRGEHARERRAQVCDAALRGIVGVRREHVEDPAAEDSFAFGLGRAKVRITHREDGEVGGEHEVAARCGLEEALEVGRPLLGARHVFSRHGATLRRRRRRAQRLRPRCARRGPPPQPCRT